MPRPSKSIILVHSTTPDQLLRSGLAVACDLANQMVKTFELLSDPALPTQAFETIIAGAKELVIASLGALAGIEKTTRPNLPPNGDIAYLKSLFNLPDTRKDSPLEQ